MTTDAMSKLKAATEYLDSIDLTELTPRTRAAGDGGALAFTPEAVRDQTAVVGSGVVSFVQGVTAERRQAIVHSALLAQLVASQRVRDSTQVMPWYDAYFEVLSNIGWVVQHQSFNTFEASSDQVEVHEAILQVAAVALSGAPAAYGLVKVSLDALRKASDDSPWITIFRRESEHAKAARFQVTLAEQRPDDQFLVTLLAFSVEATSSIKQVLLFKFRSARATLRHVAGGVTIDDAVLLGVADDLAGKVAAFVRGYISALPELGTPSH